MQKAIRRILLVTFIWGLFLSFLNKGEQGWKIFINGNPILCLFFTLILGVACSLTVRNKLVLIVTCLVLVYANFSGLRHLSWWIIAINLWIQAGVFLHGLKFWSQNGGQVNYVNPLE